MDWLDDSVDERHAERMLMASEAAVQTKAHHAVWVIIILFVHLLTASQEGRRVGVEKGQEETLQQGFELGS